jgi:hypothetical protein
MMGTGLRRGKCELLLSATKGGGYNSAFQDGLE